MKKPKTYFALLLEIPKLMWKEVSIPIYLLFIMFFGGATGFRLFFPEESWARLFYMTAITLSTVGYGDILQTDTHPYAIWYTMILMLVGMGVVLYAISAMTAFFVGGNITKILKQLAEQRKLDAMENHYIVCGCGRTGEHVLQEMLHSKAHVVVLDLDRHLLEQLEGSHAGFLALLGDATQEDVLLQAGIKRAKGLVASLPTDKDNLFLTLTARLLNPELKIVSKAVEQNIHQRLKKVGADYIVNPHLIGGLRIASEILRPHVVSFLDRMLRGKEPNIRVGEVIVPVGSTAVGKALGDLQVYKYTGLNLLAYSPSGLDEDYVYNPGPEIPLEAGSILLFVGTPEQQKKLTALL